MRRRLLAAALVLGLLLVAALPLGFMYSGSPPVSTPQKFRPLMSVPAGIDVDRNRIDDRLDSEIAGRAANGTGGEPVNVIVMLSGDTGEAAALGFARLGGVVTTGVWKYALYGFGGRIPFGRIVTFVNSRSDVLLVEKEAECHAYVAYSARQVGARPYVWSTLGLRGDANSSIAVLDTGIDGSHVDFAPGYGAGDFSKKIVGWSDEVGSSTVPVDDDGHGSHCSGLAAGNGFFSVNELGYATATSGATHSIGRGRGTVYLNVGMMVNRTGAVKASVQWSGSKTLSEFRLYNGSKSLSIGSWSQLASVSTPEENTWYDLTYNIASTPSGGYDVYHWGCYVTSVPSGTLDLLFNFSWPYTPSDDGFSAWTGIAQYSKLVGVKVLPGTNIELVSGIDWIIENRITYHITVASMSVGFDQEVGSVNVAIVNLANSGVCTVVAAGNGGSGGNYVFTPGSVDEALTVAAMNHFDDVSSYSSEGGTRYSTLKPDVTAPGGSLYAVPLFSVDTNQNDGEGKWTETVVNDAAPMMGTSMATPIVAGAAQVLVEALGGYAEWNYTRGSDQALLPKMLLLMTATETYPNLREAGSTSTSPTLDRGGKDMHEGYGRVNVDAAADAVLKTYQIGTTVSETLGKPPTLTDISVLGQRLAWARNVYLSQGIEYRFNLTVPTGADYDLYLYNMMGNAYGEPVILKKSVKAVAGGFENVTYTPVLSGTYYLVVKRARANTDVGQFTLISSSSQTVHLLLTAESNQATYTGGQPAELFVNVFNRLNPSLESTLTLTVTGPDDYYYFDFQSISVAADAVWEYSFTWDIPDVAGTYVIEASLVPPQLTAYDVAWLEVC